MSAFLDIDERAYHADLVGVAPTLSSHTAHTLVTKSPAHAFHEHPRLGGAKRAPTKAMALGVVLHRLLLGVGRELVVVEAGDWRGKMAQQARADAVLAGHEPILEDDYEAAVEAAEAVRDQLAWRGIDLGAGEREVTAAWTDPVYGVACRGRFDHLDPANATITDLKKMASAHPKAFERAAYDYGLDIQAAAYVQALEVIRPELVGRVRFRWVVLEAEAPFVTVVRTPAGSLRHLGEQRWANACRVWSRCLRSGRWPGYEDGIAEAVPWATGET